MNETAFIAVRHGNYDRDNNLSQSGKVQMQVLAQKIKEIRGGRAIILICSTAPRASQGGEILIRELEIPEELVFFEDCLWFDNSHWPLWEEMEKLIENNLREGTILLGISHLDLVPRMASFAAKKFGHKNGGFPKSEYAQGWLVDSEGFRRFP